MFHRLHFETQILYYRWIAWLGQATSHFSSPYQNPLWLPQVTSTVFWILYLSKQHHLQGDYDADGSQSTLGVTLCSSKDSLCNYCYFTVNVFFQVIYRHTGDINQPHNAPSRITLYFSTEVSVWYYFLFLILKLSPSLR